MLQSLNLTMPFPFLSLYRKRKDDPALAAWVSTLPAPVSLVIIRRRAVEFLNDHLHLPWVREFVIDHLESERRYGLEYGRHLDRAIETLLDTFNQPCQPRMRQ
tara:strand:- start:227 stop:535 length:309 start_codon:yes stop_codon:yes gene_type:complete